MDPVILITGANGFVGRSLIDFLSAKGGIRVMATDVHPNLIPFGSSSAVIEYLSGDLSDRAFMDRLGNAQPFDTVVHLAAVLSQAADMPTYFSIMNSNIQATFLLLEMAKKKNARVIFPSTALVYGGQKEPFREDMPTDPGDFYALSKSMCEQLIRFYGNKYGVRSVIFRIGILYGPSQTGVMFIPALVSALLSGKEFPMTAGEQTRDFVHADDAANAFSLAISSDGCDSPLNIGSGKGTAILDLLEKMCSLAGKTPNPLLQRERKGDIRKSVADISLAKRKIGFYSKIPLEQGLKEIVAEK